MLFPEKLKSSHGNRDKEWVSDEVRLSSQKVYNLYHLQLRYPVLRDRYLEVKRGHTTLVGSTKSAYYSNKILNASNRSREAWSIISHLNGKTTNTDNIDLLLGGIRVNDPREVANKFNEFFVGAPESINQNIVGSNDTLNKSIYVGAPESINQNIVGSNDTLINPYM
ncbi:hypothetical protein QE152_g26327 [Popillia japonica]|uniref:Uncharacterized protein n=1 Tax=Popillia japonica TaxID=7064 RepID=A0AAW1JZN8_POPJA